MRYVKKSLDTLAKPYAIGALTAHDGTQSFVIGTEKEGPLRRYDFSGAFLEEIAPGPGGVMTIAQVPGVSEQFVATAEFFSPNYGADTAGLVWYRKDEAGAWQERRIADMPYVHRFGFVEGADGRIWLLACTIKGASRTIKEDWAMPGAVYVAEVGTAGAVSLEQVKFSCLAPLQLKNHGFWMPEDHSFALIATAAGVFRLVPPAQAGEAWSYTCLLVQPTSDMCLVDFDGDGRDEMLTLSTFHGNTLRIWHETDTEHCYECVWESEVEHPFLHAIWSGMLAGEPSAVIGHRKGAMDLMRVYFDGESYQKELIESGVGSANVDVFEANTHQIIVATHRETGELALYEVHTEA